MKIYIIWLIGVILWNFGFPNAIPIADVIAAILLSFLSIGLSNTKIKNDFGALIIVKSCNIEYKKSAYLEDDLQIKSFVDSTSKTSFSMNQSIFKDEELIVKAKIHLVFINEKFKPVKIPEKILSDFKPYTSSS